MMRENEDVFVLGEDIGVYGGAFGVTRGMIEEFGPERIRNTPISESAIAGAAVGAALTGMRPILELQFSDFITIATDQIVNQAAKIRYMYGGKGKVPMVLRTPAGSGTGAAAQHSQSLEAWMAHIPGLKVIQPSTAYDAKGLLRAAIEDDNPVIFYEHKLLYRTMDEVPEEAYTLPIGKADVKRQGTDVTVVATSIMVHRALEAAGQLEKEGIQIEVIDPRTLVPLDIETVVESVKKNRTPHRRSRGGQTRRFRRRDCQPGHGKRGVRLPGRSDSAAGRLGRSYSLQSNHGEKKPFPKSRYRPGCEEGAQVSGREARRRC